MRISKLVDTMHVNVSNDIGNKEFFDLDLIIFIFENSEKGFFAKALRSEMVTLNLFDSKLGTAHEEILCKELTIVDENRMFRSKEEIIEHINERLNALFGKTI